MMENKKVMNDKELRQVNGGTQNLLPKDYYENIILNTSKHDELISQTYRRDIGRDKGAKVIFK